MTVNVVPCIVQSAAMVTIVYVYVVFWDLADLSLGFPMKRLSLSLCVCAGVRARSSVCARARVYVFQNLQMQMRY